LSGDDAPSSAHRDPMGDAATLGETFAPGTGLPAGSALTWWLEPSEVDPGTDRFHSFLDRVEVAFALAGPTGAILRANRAFCELMGRDEAELAAVGVPGITHPDDLAVDVTQIAAAKQSGAPSVEFAKRYVHADGTVIPVHLKATMARDATGTVTGALVHVLDLSRQGTELSREAREYQERFRMSFDQAPIGVSLQTLDGRFVRVNRRMCELTGYSQEELLARSVRDITHPDDVARDAEAHRRLRAGEMERYEIDKRYLGRDGRVIWVAVSVCVLRDADGAMRFFLSEWQDVTARRAAEEDTRRAYTRMRRIAETVPALVYVFDVAERRATYVNDAIERMSGYTREEYLRFAGDRYAAQFHPDDLPVILRDWEFLRDHPDGTVVELDFRFRHKDGRYRRYHCHHAVFERNPDGSLRSLVGTVEDVTDAMATQERLRHSQKMEAMGRLAGGIAHEFNNQLTAILGYADTAMQRLTRENPARDDLGQVVQAARRASLLTGQLLAFGRPQPLDARGVDVNALVQESMGLVRRVIGEHVTVDVHLAPALGTVVAEPARLTQMVLDLAIRAKDALAEGGRIVIATEDAPAPAPESAARASRWVRLTVSDDGASLDDEALAHVFEPYFSDDLSDGTGLGLATVYGFVSGLGGTVEVVRGAERGTVFVIHLPCSEPAPRAARATRHTSATTGSGGRSVLVVEDEPAVRSLIGTVLARDGFRVVEAPDGKAGLARLTDPTERFDLVVSDVVMPGLSGPEMMRRVPDQDRRPPVLFVTGYADETVAGAGGLPEGAECLRKPFSPEALVSRARSLAGAPGPAAR
jgi:PAS domain S-box-containing protein